MANPADRRRPRKKGLTHRDLVVLAFVAEHRLVLADHVAALLGVTISTASERLRALEQAKYVEHGRFYHRQPPYFLATTRGLRAAERPYRKSGIDESCYAHDVGVAWLWLGARRGVWGEAREVLSERQLRSADGIAHPVGQAADRVRAADDLEAPGPMGVRLGGYGATGRPRLHYPDLLLVTRGGKRIAFELELTRKGRNRLENIIAGYAADSRIDAVVYLVEDRALGERVERAAARYGIQDLVHVQEVRWAPGKKPQPLEHAGDRGPARAARRSSTHEGSHAARRRTREAGR